MCLEMKTGNIVIANCEQTVSKFNREKGSISEEKYTSETIKYDFM